MQHPPYIPDGYQRREERGFTLWCRPDVPAADAALIKEAGDAVLAALHRLLDAAPGRHLHVCCYHTNADARQALDRAVGPTMALAPYSDADMSLVVLQSRVADPRNGDLARVTRLLAHEITHQLVSEATGSFKVLGDDNREMRVPGWLNEGLAETVANVIGERQQANRRAVESLSRSAPPPTFGELSRHLDDLDSSRRAAAFACATGAVGMLVRERGLKLVFRHLPLIAHEFGDDEEVLPERLLALRVPVF